MKPRETLTSLPPSPSAERRSRAIKYSIAMGIRMLCVICLLFAHGWWLLFFAIGAVVLPYFAVVLANVGSAGERDALPVLRLLLRRELRGHVGLDEAGSDDIG
ncbi:hypothetical protein C5C86_08135, partial [Rathayibacter sp. AY1E4]